MASYNVFVQIVCIGLPQASSTTLPSSITIILELADLIVNLNKYVCLSGHLLCSHATFFTFPNSPNFSPFVHIHIWAENCLYMRFVLFHSLNKDGRSIQNLRKTHLEVGNVWLYAVFLGGIVTKLKKNCFLIHFWALSCFFN